ncbi:hypothetical protein OWM54_16700 [Myxococcus sp. MISCRS1]|jgi:hypothetical protein|uniref:KTSC domain-containing protein n=1 Tax=Myxococcus fulvus TaxID=33 RepID=A0A511SUZ5_MYXFU|nr:MULTISPECIES: hypothetical protein [Myxococcus]BDT31218.1 hypothetical protein MFMH1_08870 [Myxococcus sp. MH1]MBZ4395855.1 hypothetical protein [Myxococcus sp. AS-1-15]MBZ4407391.1 hypothetical protein [Myxococcus sp. XM-1-1-1]MCK8503619.1 hypothetical protein [Myxococcus fulvus]MCP3058858.1 hypothetical protein [Myxococcus guangdongensis]
MGGVERVDVREEKKGWGVEVVTSDGEVRRYRYASEAQARYFAAIFELGPRVWPPVRRGKARKAA